MTRTAVFLALASVFVLVGMTTQAVAGTDLATRPVSPLSLSSVSRQHSLVNETIKITSPGNNTVINGSALVGTVAVTNFTLNASAIGKNSTPGEGHFHVFVDGVYDGFSGYNTFNLTRLKAGNHTLKVQLFENNHSAIMPEVSHQVNIVVLSKAPTLAILDPQPNTQLNSASFTVTLNVTFFDLNASAIGKPNKPGEGHWHAYMNGVLVKMGSSLQFDLTNVSANQYNLRVELRNNNHSELQPPVFDQITIKVLPGRPAIAVSSPADGSSWNSTTVPYRLYLENFMLNESAVGKNNSPGEGHYHILVDGVYVGFGARTGGNLTNLTAGTHSARFELHENNHSAVMPMVWDTISLTVNPPGVMITSPANGTKLTTNSTTLALAVSNFTLNGSAIGNPWNPGEGHLHFSIDGAMKGMSASTSISVKDLADGTRKLTVELRNNDHSPLQPPVTHSIWVEVDTTPPPPPVPTVKIDSPANGTKLKTNSTSLTFTVGNFKLNGSAMGGANKPGEGHAHVLVDGNVTGMIDATSFTAKDLKDGTRKITVELVNNDHSPLSPAVSDSVWLLVDTSKPGGPSLAMLKPVNLQKFTTQDVPVEFEVKNLNLVQPTGQANQKGEGHVHLIVGGAPAIWVWNNSPSAYLLKLGAGQHTIKGVLVNNDHTPVVGVPEVSVSVTVEIAGQTPAPDNTGLFLGIGLLILLALAGLLFLVVRRRKKAEPEKDDGKTKDDEHEDKAKDGSGGPEDEGSGGRPPKSGK